MTTKKITSILFIIVGIAIAIWFYKAYKIAPALPAYENDLINEREQAVKIADFKGKYVLISYFQSWCGDCIRELTAIDDLQATVGKDKLKVLMVTDEGWAKTNRFKEKYCNTLDYYQSAKALNELNIRVFPTTYLINPEGIVIMSKLERYDWNNQEVIDKVH